LKYQINGVIHLKGSVNDFIKKVFLMAIFTIHVLQNKDKMNGNQNQEREEGSESNKQAQNRLFSILLGYMIVLAGCHSTVHKEIRQAVEKKDGGKTIIAIGNKKSPTDFFVAINKIIHNDTLKVYRYNNGLIKCSLNKLWDTITTSNPFLAWDEINWLIDGEDENESIFMPDDLKPRMFILNDTVLIINVIDSKGRVNLFLLNRTKNELKFASENNYNPICNLSTYVYVDLKHNVILNHDKQYQYGHTRQACIRNDTLSEGPLCKEIYNIEGIEGQPYLPTTISPYFIHRYKIINRHFIQTDLDTSFFRVFLKIDVFNPDGARLFYHIVANCEHWKRDMY
jgi:hypothetical protein